MIRFLIVFNSFFLLLLYCRPVSAQVIDLDKEQELLAPDKFEKGTMYYISPGDFGYQLGLRNMYSRLGNFLETDPSSFNRFVGFGIGWKRKALFYNLYVAFQPFTTPIINTSGNVRTVADFSSNYADLTIGRAIYSTQSHDLILKGGLGFFGNVIQVRQYNSNNFDLDNLWSAQGTAWPLLEHYSGTFDFALEYIPKPIRSLSVVPSFQLGYKGSVGSPNWGSPDAFLTNTISDRSDMIYLRISLVVFRQY